MWTEGLETGLSLARDTERPRNLLLQSLPFEEFERLSPLLQKIPLSLGACSSMPGSQ